MAVQKILPQQIDTTGSSNTQVLTSNGTATYWAAGASGGFANGQSITVANISITGSLTANTTTGTDGQVLASNGTGLYWTTPEYVTGATPARQQYTGDGSTTIFAVSGGYTPNLLNVYLNGVMLRNGSEVIVTNGSTFTITNAPPNGSLIDAIGSLSLVNAVTAGKTIALALIFGG